MGPILETRSGIEELGERGMSALELEEGFCWDHGYHLGRRCPRCSRNQEETTCQIITGGEGPIALTTGISKNAA